MNHLDPKPVTRLALIELLFIIVFCTSATMVCAQEPSEPSYDIVLMNGRVMDPESGLDAVRSVGITNGKIAAISDDPIQGKENIDANGLVVAPGFIDLHAHGQDLFSSSLQVRDGVTTALELELGVFPVAQWYASREGKALIHYGATTGHWPARGKLKHGLEVGHMLTNPEMLTLIASHKAWAYEPATAEELSRLGTLLEQGLDEGALGIGYGINYTPGARREEILRCFRLAARRDVPNFVHIRSMGQIEPGSSIEAAQEVIANAAATGASVHIVHIGSIGLGQLPILLDMIEGCQRNGLDVTTEVYPYTAGSTFIGAAIFDPGWRERLGADYNDIEWVATGERLTEESFNNYRQQQPDGMVIAHIMKEEMVEQAIAHPQVMIASDGVPFIDGKAHPRGAGTFARVLGRYVRERKTLSLMDALRKMTLMPAQRLEKVASQMRLKGRTKVGADADITIFDANEVMDQATFENPAQPSAGIIHVLVGGTFVVRDAELVEGVFPGRAIRRVNAREQE
jgi:N-acyl-D-aspartate/D-glutamate deacylase